MKNIFKRYNEEPEMVEIKPTIEDQLHARIWRGIVAQIFVRYTPKLERHKWRMPLDDMSGYIVIEEPWLRIYRKNGSYKIEVRYEQLPECSCTDELQDVLGKLLVVMEHYITLDVMFQTMAQIASTICDIVYQHPTIDLWSSLEHFKSILVDGFNENEMTWLPATVIFHDSDTFVGAQQYRVSALTVTDRWTKEVGVLTMVDVKDRRTLEESMHPDYPPKGYVTLRDKYARGEIGVMYLREEMMSAMGVGRELSARRRLELNAAHAAGAHEFCMALLAAS